MLRLLLGADEFYLEDQHLVEGALADFVEGTADFADYLIALRNQSAGRVETVNLDRRAGNTHGMRTL